MDQQEIEKFFPWLTIELFQKCLEKKFPNNLISVTDYTIKAALPKGENFASTMLRAIVTYSIDEQKNCEIRFIIKAAVTDSTVLEVLNEMELFHKEIANFDLILPEVYKLLEEIGDQNKMSARCYGTSVENSYIIFEDLTTRGYANSDKKNGLTVKQYELILKKLARWHAANAILIEKKPELFERFSSHIMHKTDTFKKMAHSMSKVLSDITKTMPGFEHLSEKFQNFSVNIYPKMIESVKQHKSDFLTLCHGDLWSNNIMFTNDSDGTPLDSIFVDYQISFIGPAVCDLSNTLYSSSHGDIRSDDYDKLVQYYHQELLDTLIKLNYSKTLPTLTEIQAQLIQRGVIYSTIGLFIIGMRAFDKLEDMDMAVLTGENEDDKKFLRSMLEKSKDNEVLKFHLNYFDRRGYFD